jgi:hypothetical protein
MPLPRHAALSVFSNAHVVAQLVHDAAVDAVMLKLDLQLVIDGDERIFSHLMEQAEGYSRIVAHEQLVTRPL